MPSPRSNKDRLPDHFPAGTRYIVEGGSDRRGRFRVTLRRLVFPDGRQLELAVATAPRRADTSGRPRR
jgi:hypothetical protein